jgi:hypothetical protein
MRSTSASLSSRLALLGRSLSHSATASWIVAKFLRNLSLRSTAAAFCSFLLVFLLRGCCVLVCDKPVADIIEKRHFFCARDGGRRAAAAAAALPLFDGGDRNQRAHARAPRQWRSRRSSGRLESARLALVAVLVLFVLL